MKYTLVHTLLLSVRKYGEQLTWTGALLFLFFMDVSYPGASLCFFKFLGFASCIGCGLGHSIHYALHLDVASSFKEHLFGVPATLIIIVYLFNSFVKTNKAICYGSTHAYDVTRNSTG